METVEKTIKIPSNGYFGGPKEVTLRAMTTKEEKILLSTRDYTVFDRLLKSCCIEPKDLDTSLLHQSDIMYLVYELRQLTFGSKYTQTVTCPVCGFKQEIEIDITEMEVSYLDTENVSGLLIAELPVSGDNLQLKLLSSGDIRAIDKKIKMKVSKGKVKDPDTYEFTVKLMEAIESKNGEPFNNEDEKKNYVDNLHMQDLVEIQNTISRIDFGLDNTIVRECAKCHDDMEVAGLICPEFFRPTK